MFQKIINGYIVYFLGQLFGGQLFELFAGETKLKKQSSVPHPNQRRSKTYKNFRKQKTRQENLRDKYKKQKIIETHDQVKILTMNVNSVHSHVKSQLAKLAIKESKPDIAILTETKLGPLSNTFNVPGYQIETQADRKEGARGIMILSKLGMNVIEATSKSLEVEEIQVANCQFGDLTIIGIYRSPTILTLKEAGVVQKCPVGF